MGNISDLEKKCESFVDMIEEFKGSLEKAGKNDFKDATLTPQERSYMAKLKKDLSLLYAAEKNGKNDISIVKCCFLEYSPEGFFFLDKLRNCYKEIIRLEPIIREELKDAKQKVSEQQRKIDGEVQTLQVNLILLRKKSVQGKTLDHSKLAKEIKSLNESILHSKRELQTYRLKVGLLQETLAKATAIIAMTHKKTTRQKAGVRSRVAGFFKIKKSNTHKSTYQSGSANNLAQRDMPQNRLAGLSLEPVRMVRPQDKGSRQNGRCSGRWAVVRPQ